MRNCKSLYRKMFIVYKPFIVGIKTNNLPRTTRFGLFHKTNTCPRWLLLSGPKSGYLIQVWVYCLIVDKLCLEWKKKNSIVVKTIKSCIFLHLVLINLIQSWLCQQLLYCELFKLSSGKKSQFDTLAISYILNQI